MPDKTTVLIVEDDFSSRNFIQAYIEEVPIKDFKVVLSTKNQNRSLAEYEKPLNVDVVVLDFNLIGITGLEILEVLRQEQNPNRDIPIIFVPGKLDDLGTSEERDKLLQEMKVLGIIQKPFIINTVFGRIRDWLREKEGKGS